MEMLWIPLISQNGRNHQNMWKNLCFGRSLTTYGRALKSQVGRSHQKKQKKTQKTLEKHVFPPMLFCPGDICIFISIYLPAITCRHFKLRPSPTYWPTVYIYICMYVWEALVQSQVRFNRVPEKVLEKVPEKVPEKVWEALVQSQVRFNRVPEKVWEALVQSQLRFNRVLEKVPEKAWEALVQRRLPRRSGRLWRRARSDSTGFPRRFQRRCGRLWCRARLGSTGLRRSSGEGSGRLWGRARSGSTGFRRRFRRRSGRLWSMLRRFQRLASQHASERLVKIRRCGCWGYHRSLFFSCVFDLVPQFKQVQTCLGLCALPRTMKVLLSAQGIGYCN